MAKTKIMYLEYKGEGTNGQGEGRIVRISFSKSGETLRYAGAEFRYLRERGVKANYYEVSSGEYYWITRARKDGADRLFPGPVYIDEDVREEYWIKIRQLPEHISKTKFESLNH
ncbi:MAG: 1-deoxy-D-xylulose-5-phosphate synthase [bacterium]